MDMPPGLKAGDVRVQANTDKITVVSKKMIDEAKHETLESCGDGQRQSKVWNDDDDDVKGINMIPLSMLSLRRYLQAFTTKLDLYYYKRNKHDTLIDDDERIRKCIERVNDIIGLRKSSGTRLEELRLFLPLSGEHAQHIDEWVRFALSQRVESLVLLLLNWRPTYKLNVHLDYFYLRRLCTFCVDVSGEGVEMLLRNCPLLEQVSVECSLDLLGLEIHKPYPAFKRLQISWCSNLSSVVVRDSNIESIKFYSHTVKWVLVDVPHLTEICVGGLCTAIAENVVEMFSSVLPQLHLFNISFEHMNFTFLYDFCSRFGSSVVMTSLKQLVVNIRYHMEVYYEEDLLALTDLIRASPRLERFVIEETYRKNSNLVDFFFDGKNLELDRKIPMAYPHLKEMEFVGYRGVSNHIQIVKHLVENAIALETIFVHPRGFKLYCWQTWDPIPRRKFDPEMFARAEALKSRIPFEINVKILN